MAEASRGEPTRRRESRETRRRQLMDATLMVLARKGLAATTLTDVADAAGLSRGLVIFYFESKERLLFETLSRLSAEYDANWREALARAEPSPAARLRVLVTADFSESNCAPEKVAAWFAFFAEAAGRSDYRDLCWARDDAFLDAIVAECRALEAEGGYGHAPGPTAMSIYALQEGLWLRLMLGNSDLGREDALAIALGLIGKLFPDHFTADGDLR